MSGSISLRSQGNEPVPAPGGGGGSDATYETGPIAISYSLAIGETRTFEIPLSGTQFTNGWLIVKDGPWTAFGDSLARMAHIMFTDDPLDGFSIASIFGTGSPLLQARTQSVKGFYQFEDGFLTGPQWGANKLLVIDECWITGDAINLKITNSGSALAAHDLDVTGRYYVFA